MRILSKSNSRATALVLAMLAGSCRLAPVPWAGENVNEYNIAFTLQRNLIELHSLTIDGRAGRFLLASAAPRTIVDPAFATGGTHNLQLAEKQTVRVSASPLGLGGVADAMIGADAWQRNAISIDYRAGLVTYQLDGIRPGLMTIYRYGPGEPMIEVEIDGQRRNAIVDTSSPDTLVLPSHQPVRGTARVRIDGVDFGDLDVQYANVAQARIGNRLLAHFLVTIDYGERMVGLWRDPRIPITAAP
jgi:hypothetical protein